MTVSNQWDANPVAAFQAFIDSPDFVKTSRRLGQGTPSPVSKRSAHVYKAMFNKFAYWMHAERRAFSHLGEQDLVGFVSQLRGKGEQDSGITQRYLRLIERCFEHLAVAPNPATIALKLATDNHYLGKDKRMAVLDANQVDLFVSALPPMRPATRTRSDRKPLGWKQRRTHAMQATILFSGLRVAEAVGLQITEVDDPLGEGDIALRITPEGKHDTSYEHSTILRNYGAVALRAWLIERKQLDIPGSLVFPSNVRGEPLEPGTVYDQVKATFERAGIEVGRQGARTLRNTFAVGKLQEGVDREEVREYLGLALDRSTEIYELAAGCPKKAVM
ncbi:site-specific integrase [Massilia sp. 9096]|uniref:tyrosine-type recombinase/integrase n=1 Tax=Massilia sp. 9096 TaxID=1500894 RepID=UPI000567B65F|nr:site-specific integrase [Massilia sp. 9096]